MRHRAINLTCQRAVSAHYGNDIMVGFHLLTEINIFTESPSYFLKMLVIFSSMPFYSEYVHLPHEGDLTPSKILENSKFYPFFKDVLGAIDSTHINCCPSAVEREASRNRYGLLSQNCLAICDFNMQFWYIFSGWDGSMADSTMFQDARITDLPIPKNKYYLADAGFPTCNTLLIPY